MREAFSAELFMFPLLNGQITFFTASTMFSCLTRIQRIMGALGLQLKKRGLAMKGLVSNPISIYVCECKVAVLVPSTGVIEMEQN